LGSLLRRKGGEAKQLPAIEAVLEGIEGRHFFAMGRYGAVSESPWFGFLDRGAAGHEAFF
jgi:hypothetical protein